MLSIFTCIYYLSVCHLWRSVYSSPFPILFGLFLLLFSFSSSYSEYSSEALMLKLKLQYFGHLMRRTDSLEKTLMLGEIEGEGDEMVGGHHQRDGPEFE